MTKKKNSDPVKQPKRKRRPKKLPASEAEKKSGITDEKLREIYDFVSTRHIPRVMAEIARRFGNPHVSPRDFHCGCIPDVRTGFPKCTEEPGVCAHAGRFAETELDDDATPFARRKFDRTRNEVINAKVHLLEWDRKP